MPESKEGLKKKERGKKKNHIEGGMSQEDTQKTLQELSGADNVNNKINEVVLNYNPKHKINSHATMPMQVSA